MIILCEGPDNVGKGTQIQKLLPLIHNKPTHQLHYSAVKGFPTPEETLKYSKEIYDSMFRLLYNGSVNCNFILDRSHIGEMIYAPMYRKYSGDYVLELEKNWKKHTEFWSQIYLVTFIDEPENLIKRDDGLSFSIDIEQKRKEINLFIDATKKSNVQHKHIINIFGRTIDQVHAELRKFLNV